MNLLNGFKKLLGEAGQVANNVGQAAGNVVKSIPFGPVAQPMVNRAPQQVRQRIPQQMQQIPMMNRYGENLSQDELRRRTSMQNGQYARQFVGAKPVRPEGVLYEDEIYPQYELPQVRRVQEDDAFGYTDNGIQPLSNMGPGESWEPMYQTPLQRLMRKR